MNRSMNHSSIIFSPFGKVSGLAVDCDTLKLSFDSGINGEATCPLRLHRLLRLLILMIVVESQGQTSSLQLLSF